MKKILKMFFVAIIAAVTAFSVLAFAGCESNEEKDDTNTSPGAISSAIDEITDTEYSALELEAKVDFEGEEKINVNAKLNLSGTADVNVSCISLGEYDGVSFYQYVFMRDWKVYGGQSLTEVKDFSSAELEGYVDLKQAVSAVLEYVCSQIDVEDGAVIADVAANFDLKELFETAYGAYNYEILGFAKAANAASVSKDALTVDLNKLVYNYATDVKSVVNSLKGTTTLGEILNNKTLKKYLQVFTELVEPEELVEQIIEAIAQAEGSEQLPEEATAILAKVKQLFNEVKPDENSSTYDYLVKLAGSQELVDLINSFMPTGTGLTQKLTEFTLNNIYALASESVNADIEPLLVQFKQMTELATSGITQTSCTIKEGDEVLFVMSDAKIVYNYGKNGLTSQKFEINFVTEGGKISVYATLTYNEKEFAASDFVTLPAQLPVIPDVDLGGDEGDDTGDGTVVTIPDVTGSSLIFNRADVDYANGGYNDLSYSDRARLNNLLDETQTIIFNDDGTFKILANGTQMATGTYVQTEDTVVLSTTYYWNITLLYNEGEWLDYADYGVYEVTTFWQQI